ncbi:tail fiber domain-containing protein [Citrobacter koseri]|uniref:tail fiber domain-containing protein n=1 Tax=Citrobacter koseri TaxID=545 RepID=UPI0019055FE8|nr:tail fiber domain-containing protein [Citrobacter koseri]MBJ9121084.1 tail fiber domain-containing protein [Citrobacter koseri]
MSAGTLTLTNNSATVTGSGTAFSTELSAGDFIVVTVGGVPYTLPVNAVNSNTSLTLVSNYTGPTQSGAAWFAVPRVALNMVTAALVAQSAEALRGLNYDKQNWQQLFSVNGNITVTLPDGSQFSGPSWLYMVNTVATKTNGAVPINQGGTGATNAADARTGLELGSSATKNTGTSGNVVPLLDADGVTFDKRLSIGGGNYSSQLRLISNNDGYGQMEIYSLGGTVRCRLAYINSNDLYYYKYVGGAYSFGVMFPQSGGTLALTGTSDIHFKDDVKDMDPAVSLDNINRMRPVSFVFKADKNRNVRRGVIAQEIMEIDPQYVHLNIDRNPETQEDTERYSLDNNALLLDALLAIQALSKKVETMELVLKNDISAKDEMESAS